MNLELDGTKIALPQHAERLRAFLAGEHIAPITIDMAMTQKCQMGCVFCYANLQQFPSDPIDWPIYERFLEDCTTIGHRPGEGVKAISLVSDGESTLSKHYGKFVQRAKHLGIDIASGTNGEALRPDDMPMLADCLTYLRINLNSASAIRNAKIMGTSVNAFWRVIRNIERMVRVKRERNANVTIGLQMVLMPHYKEEIVPLAKYGKTLGVDYLIIKHCSDDEAGRLGVDYDWYRTEEAINLLKEAEAQSDDTYKVHIKWSKFATGRDRQYSKCYGTALHLQMSGSGVVAPCGSFFNERYKRFHIGDIAVTRFRDIWNSEAYREVIEHLRSDQFDPRKECETLCLQDRTNLALFNLIDKGEALPVASDTAHRNFL